MKNLKIISGNANIELSKKISKHLQVPLSRADVKRFADGEVYVRIEENIRGKDVFVIQPTCRGVVKNNGKEITRSVDENLMELLVILDAIKRSSAWRITAVIPYFGYARQDRKTHSRMPISAKLVANIITKAGADRVLSIDLHAGQIQGFFDIPVDNLFAAPVIIEHLKKKNFKNPCIVSPDTGGVERARAFAKTLNAPLAILDKRRAKPNEAKIYNIVGNVKNKECVLVDDMLDTAGTVSSGANALKENGASRIFAVASHPVFSGEAISRLLNAPIEETIITDTIPITIRHDRITQLSVGPLLAHAIKRIHKELSVSSLFII